MNPAKMEDPVLLERAVLEPALRALLVAGRSGSQEARDAYLELAVAVARSDAELALGTAKESAPLGIVRAARGTD